MTILPQNKEYINGASADPPVITINTPISNKIRMSGTNQYFFRVLKKRKSSFKNSIICSNYINVPYFKSFRKPV
jgi:hypothetical protein